MLIASPFNRLDPLLLKAAQRPNYARQLDDLNVLRTLLPIVTPANNHVAPSQRMPVLAKIPALKFKLNPHTLPAVRANLPLGFAVRESLLNRLDHVTQIFRQHSK